MPLDSPSVLIVRLDAIGDAVTLVPLVAALRSRARRIGALLRPQNADVFARAALDRRHVAGPNLRALAAEIEARRYDVALVATEKPEGYRVAKAARIRRRIGFENGWGKPLKTLWVRRMCTSTVFRTAGLDPRAPHECEVLFELARSVVGDVAPARDPAVLRPILLDRPVEPDARIAFQVTDKWLRLGARIDDVVAMARRLNGLPVRWIAAASERHFAERFAGRTGVTPEYFERVAHWKEALAAARAVVAPDSGAVHIAGMAGTPVVAIYAYTNFTLQSSRWAPWASPSSLVRLERGWPEAAFDGLQELLSGTRSSSYTG